MRGVADQSGPWDRPGRTRRVLLSDGSEAHEELTAFDRPDGFAYRVVFATGPLRHLVHHADGQWWFAPDGAGRTRIRWRYTFAPTRPRLRPFVAAIVAPLWRAYATRVLATALAYVR